MTLDVTIGKLKVENENLSKNAIDPCPKADSNICDPDKTIFPKMSKRSGSTGFWRFWRVLDNELYEMFRENPASNDKDYAYIKPVIERIKSLEESDFDREKIREHVIQDKERDERLENNVYGIDDIDEEIDSRIIGHKSRLKWLKYWSERAVELYGNQAAIRFR